MVRILGGLFQDQQAFWRGWDQDPGRAGGPRNKSVECFAMNFGSDWEGKEKALPSLRRTRLA